MKVISLAVASVSALLVAMPLGTAGAADMPVKAPPAPVAAPFSWTGFYAGLNLGGTWADNDSTYVGATAISIVTHAVGLRSASAIGGGQIGGNWQTGMFVLGAEADIDVRNLSASGNGALTPSGSLVEQVALKENWVGTVRGRLGLAEGRALFYATGGLAYGDIEDSYTKTYPTTGLTTGSSGSLVRAGWAAGGGIDYAIWKNVAIGVEFLHVDLGSTTLTTPAGVVLAQGRATFANRSDIVRARVDWLFGASPK